MSAFVAATQSGDLNALTQLLASDVRVVTDGGGKVASALNVIDGADRAARFLVGATRKRAGAWWRDDFTLRFATVNGLPGVIVDAPHGAVQTAAFEIEGDLIRALYVVRNPDKLRHLAAPSGRTRAVPPEQGEIPVDPGSPGSDRSSLTLSRQRRWHLRLSHSRQPAPTEPRPAVYEGETYGISEGLQSDRTSGASRNACKQRSSGLPSSGT